VALAWSKQAPPWALAGSRRLAEVLCASCRRCCWQAPNSSRHRAADLAMHLCPSDAFDRGLTTPHAQVSPDTFVMVPTVGQTIVRCSTVGIRDSAGILQFARCHPKGHKQAYAVPQHSTRGERP
jgi:hypothetical protein